MKARTTVVLILSLVAAVVVVRAQGSDDISSPKLRIAYEKFKPLYDAKKVVVIDTRDQASFDMGHIPGSRVIPADDIGKHVEELRKLGKPIVTYCSCPAEHTSARAALTLQKAGLDAHALLGGWNKWLSAGNQVERKQA